MEYKISDLLDSVAEDCAQPLDGHMSASAERIKELTMMKIHANEAAAHSVRRHGNRILIVAAVAVLVLALSVAAYAAGWFGLSGVLKKESVGATTIWQVENQQPVATTPPQAGKVTMTQPQDGPEQYMAKADNVRAAWDEWTACRDGYEEQMPWLQPGETMITDDQGNCYAKNKATGAERLLEIPDDELREYYEAHEQAVKDLGYDYRYGVATEEMAAKLEEIAVKYGLRLRKGEPELRWSNELTSIDGDPRFLAPKEFPALMAAELGRGRVLTAAPVHVDKLYWYSTGTFAFNMSFADESPYVYGHFTCWDDMMTEMEFTKLIEDVSAVAERSHTAPDGTEFAVISSGEECIFYAYLERGFFTGSFETTGMSDTEIDALIDTFVCSNMGK